MKQKPDSIITPFFFWLMFICIQMSAQITAAQETVFEGIKNINGNKIFCRVIGNGAPLVVVHGGPGLAHDYLYGHFKNLADSYRLFFYDQRGCGLSAAFAENERISIDMMVEDLEGIRKEFGIGKINLAGQSWGALIALNYALKYPQYLNTILLLEPSPLSSEYLPKVQQTILSRLSKSDIEKLTSLTQNSGLKKNPVLFKEFLSTRMKSYFYDTTYLKHLNFNYFDSLRVEKFFSSSSAFGPYLSGFNLYGKINDIKCPVLVLRGDYDIIPNESVERLSGAISKSELHIIKNCGHFIHIEQPDIYFRTIRAFLNLYVNGKTNKTEHQFLNDKKEIKKPEIFAPGFISSSFFEHSSPEFSKDGMEVLWTVVKGPPGSEAVIKKSDYANGKWSVPKDIKYLGGYDDMYPVFSFDFKRIYFSSGRIKPGSKESDLRGIWFVEKTSSEWSPPVLIGFDSLDIYGLSVAKNGNIYFMGQNISEKQKYDIYSAKYNNGKYDKPVKLESPINSEYYEDGPFVDLDEKYLLFESNRPGGFGGIDIYISRKENGKWGTPVNLGKEVNSAFSDRFPKISRDKKYVFWGNNSLGSFDIYSISAKTVKNLEFLEENR